MNYGWQTVGLTRNGKSGIVDYSRAAMWALNEAAINEAAGLGPAAAQIAVQHWVPAANSGKGAFVTVNDGSGPIDWNGDGDTTDVNISVDTNNDGSVQTLNGFDDWGNIKFLGGAIGSSGYFVPPLVTSEASELVVSDLVDVLPPDTTPPTTTASVWPSPNGAGWNRTPVEVTLTATDDLSGVARTVYALDGGAQATATGPIPIAAEGIHDLEFHSVDFSQNVEDDQHLPVRIDLTAPEFVISFDPDADQIVVTARDSLSGVDPGPVAPASCTPTLWTDFGSDVAELRAYRVADVAGNLATLLLKVRCSPLRWEASVLGVRYDDQQGHQSSRAKLTALDASTDRWPAETARRESEARDHGPRETDADRVQQARGRVAPVQPNTIIFERVVGRGSAKPLLGSRQAISLGRGDGRTTVSVRYDALDDLSLLSHESGSGGCSEPSAPVLTSDLRGLLLLHLSTHRGHLTVEE